MVKYLIDEINDDMVLGESIFLPTGELLLAAGFRIKEHYRRRLKQLGFQNVFVEVEGTEEVKPGAVISEDAQKEMSQAIEDTSSELAKGFQEFRESSNQEIADIIRENRGYLNKFIMSTGMVKTLHQFLDEIMNQSSIVLNLSALKKSGNGFLTHALNVTVTSLCIGRKYRYPYEELKQLGIGALNYDLGLIALSPELLAKSYDEFTETDIKTYRQHTVYGFLMLSQNHSIPATSSAVSLQHHEREDGSGYPQGLKGDNRPPLKDFSRANLIHRFAQIISVADTYDAFISGRQYENIEPSEAIVAIKKVIEMSGTKLNADIVKTLCSIVPLYPIGTRIKILRAPSTNLEGYFGVIARDNPDNLEAPQIIVYETKNRQKIKPLLIDMSKHKGFALELVI